MTCPSCGGVDLDPDRHPSSCALEIYQRDPHIGSTHYKDWWVSTVQLPMFFGRDGGWETMLTYKQVLWSVTAHATENEARYWHLRIVMDLIRSSGNPMRDNAETGVELLLLLMANDVAIWCDVHGKWNTQCGCKL